MNDEEHLVFEGYEKVQCYTWKLVFDDTTEMWYETLALDYTWRKIPGVWYKPWTWFR